MHEKQRSSTHIYQTARVLLQSFSTTALPVLLQLLQHIAGTSSEAAELAHVMRAALKTLWSCLYIAIPEVLINNLDQSRLLLQV